MMFNLAENFVARLWEKRVSSIILLLAVEGKPLLKWFVRTDLNCGCTVWFLSSDSVERTGSIAKSREAVQCCVESINSIHQCALCDVVQ